MPAWIKYSLCSTEWHFKKYTTWTTVMPLYILRQWERQQIHVIWCRMGTSITCRWVAAVVGDIWGPEHSNIHPGGIGTSEPKMSMGKASLVPPRYVPPPRIMTLGHRPTALEFRTQTLFLPWRAKATPTHQHTAGWVVPFEGFCIGSSNFIGRVCSKSIHFFPKLKKCNASAF